MVKVVIKVKSIKQLELFEEIMLNIPIVEKCDYRKESAKETVFEIEIENGDEFCITLHFLKEGYPKQIQNLVNQIEGAGYHVVAAPYVSDASGKLCRKRNVGYIDAVGNCLFQYHSLYVSITGNKNNEVKKRALKSIFERTSIVSSRILRLMFEDVYKKWRIKELAENAECSMGQVAKVKDFLLKNAWVNQTKDGIELVSVEEMLKEWAEIYGSRENETVECYSLDSVADIEAKLHRMKEECGIDYYLSGFSGGVRYQPVVRYKKVHCYIRQEDIKEAVAYLGLKEVDSGSNVSFIIPYDECVLQDCRVIQNAKVVSPIQIYLDCVGLKGRGEELADAIVNKEIK